MAKSFTKAAALLLMPIGMAVSTNASAAIYTYQTDFNQYNSGLGLTDITIDTVAGSIHFLSNNMDMTMYDTDLANWDSTSLSQGLTYLVDNVSGTFDFDNYGRWSNSYEYDAYFSTSPKYTQFRLSDSGAFIWTYGAYKPERYGHYYTADLDGKSRWVTQTSSTSGGTDVPEPGALGLFGLALAAIGFGRYRRRKTAAGLA